MISGILFFTGVYCLNMMSSYSGFEMLCWTSWFLVDIGVVFTAGTDVVLFPIMWILVALNYRFDLRHLIESVNNMNKSGRSITSDFSEIMKRYADLFRLAKVVDQTSPPVLLAITLGTTSYICTTLFVIVYSSNMLPTITQAVALITPVSTGLITLLIAAGVTSMAQDLHHRFCSLASNQGALSCLTDRQRSILNLMIEETGRKETIFALYTMDGQRYTSELLLFYLIDTCLHYTLLLTFDRSLKLH